MASKIRQKIIDKAVKSNKSERVLIGEGEDAIEVEVRVPSLGESLGFMRSGDDPRESAVAMLKAAIVCTFDPETGERVFDPSDETELLNQPMVIQSMLLPIVGAMGRLIESAQNAAKL